MSEMVTESRLSRIESIATDQPGHPTASVQQYVRALVELTKPRITKLVVVTTGVGLALAAMGHAWNPGHLAVLTVTCLLGTALSASSANALNQWWERRRDALMPRTCARPLPTDRLAPATAWVFGVMCGVIGVSMLAAFVSLASAAVAAATILIYVLLYTPSKPMTTTSTIIGAVPGALPPVIGWAAVSGDGASFQSLLHPAPWTLFAIMFVWQIPHFLAIAWRHRDGYAAGGFRVLPLADPTGTRTARATLVWLFALVPVSLTPVMAMPDLLGWVYVIAAIALGVFFIRPALSFANDRDDASAKRVFIASIMYLPLLLGAMVIDALLSTFLFAS